MRPFSTGRLLLAAPVPAASTYTAHVKCDKCENEATVHEVSIKGGKRQEKHLCEKCAREQGVGPAQTHAPVEKLVQGYIAVQSKPEPAPAQGTALCSGCGLAFAQFRTTGVLGCPKCYAAFEAQLSPLLARAHEGGTHHVGKAPMSGTPGSGVGGAAAGGAGAGSGGGGLSADDGERIARRLAVLRRSLEEAVQGEQYEKAASLRDEIQRLQNGGASGSGSGGSVSGPGSKAGGGSGSAA